MTTFNLRAPNNATFRLTLDMSALAAVYNLAAATIRMQARVAASDAAPAFEWVTGGASGVVTFDPATKLCVFAAPEASFEALSGPYVYDARAELPGGVDVPLLSGRLFVSAGVTRTSGDSAKTGVSGIGDTVSIDGVRGSTVAPVPVSLSAAVAAAQAAAAASAASAASLSPASLATALAALPSAQIAALAQAIIVALPAQTSSGAPVPAGQSFIDTSGFVVIAQ